jgi:hypothetical protein
MIAGRVPEDSVARAFLSAGFCAFKVTLPLSPLCPRWLFGIKILAGVMARKLLQPHALVSNYGRISNLDQNR